MATSDIPFATDLTLGGVSMNSDTEEREGDEIEGMIIDGVIWIINAVDDFIPDLIPGEE